MCRDVLHGHCAPRTAAQEAEIRGTFPDVPDGTLTVAELAAARAAQAPTVYTPSSPPTAAEVRQMTPERREVVFQAVLMPQTVEIHAMRFAGASPALLAPLFDRHVRTMIFMGIPLEEAHWAVMTMLRM